MTLRDIIDFCMNNGVEVSIGFDPHTEFITLKLRRGSAFQVDYSVVNPDDVNDYDVWDEIFKSILDGMLRQINDREHQRDATKAVMLERMRSIEYQERQDLQFQRIKEDLTRPQQHKEG